MSFVTVGNTGDSPVLLDSEGRTVGGGEWAAADPDDEVTKAALEAGRLVEVEVPDDPDPNRTSPQAVEAINATKSRNDNPPGDEPEAQPTAKKAAAKTAAKDKE